MSLKIMVLTNFSLKNANFNINKHFMKRLTAWGNKDFYFVCCWCITAIISIGFDIIFERFNRLCKLHQHFQSWIQNLQLMFHSIILLSSCHNIHITIILNPLIYGTDAKINPLLLNDSYTKFITDETII